MQVLPFYQILDASVMGCPGIFDDRNSLLKDKFMWAFLACKIAFSIEDQKIAGSSLTPNIVFDRDGGVNVYISDAEKRLEHNM